MGIPYDARFASIMVGADYHMKRVTNGTANLSLDRFSSLSDKTLDEAIRRMLADEPLSIAGMNRFWFTPGQAAYHVTANRRGAYLDRLDVMLRDEAEVVSPAGEIRPAGHVNGLAREFSSAFSQRYQEIADRIPEHYRELENLFRHVSLARALQEAEAFVRSGLDPAFLLDGFMVPRVGVPNSLPGLAEVRHFEHKNASVTRKLILPSCGGVSIRFDDTNTVYRRDYAGLLSKALVAVTCSPAERRRSRLARRPGVRGVLPPTWWSSRAFQCGAVSRAG